MQNCAQFTCLPAQWIQHCPSVIPSAALLPQPRSHDRAITWAVWLLRVKGAASQGYDVEKVVVKTGPVDDYTCTLISLSLHNGGVMRIYALSEFCAKRSLSCLSLLGGI